ncbi:MAG: pseudouridine synthase, partial [Lutibacter sp.]|nr:pseudouridine synthase [Lutibacter sp.]
RQVRKMTAAVGFPTLRLIRVRVGNLHINAMKAGEVKEIQNFDL